MLRQVIKRSIWSGRDPSILCTPLVVQKQPRRNRGGTLPNRRIVHWPDLRKIWRKTRPYPPNFHDHHVFLPSLKQMLQEIEAERNPVNINDIGLSTEDYSASVSGKKKLPKMSREERRAASKINEKEVIKVETKEQLVSLIDVSVAKKRLDYSALDLMWLKSEEGKQQIQELAHHYHLYRDLFSSPSQTSLEETTLPKVVFPPFKPLPDHLMHDLYKEWFPGSVRYKKPKAREIYHFTSHVPMIIEFCVSPTVVREWDEEAVEEDPESLVSSPVFRGNIVTPLYASAKPSVVIDARSSQSSSSNNTLEPGSVKVLTDEGNKNHYSLGLFNLDSILGDDKPVCHWMVTDIGLETEREVMSFMPVYGIQGLGYHRYVFLLLQHQESLKNVKEVNEFSFQERQLDPLSLIQENNGIPVGLSWFQSCFDKYSQHVMHHSLNIRSPAYEYIEEPEPKMKQVKHPFAAPFNLYLDHYRDPKEINRYTLLERLKGINPFNYESQFDVDPLPNAYGRILSIKPSWMQSTVWKKRMRLGQYRYLRPHSVKIPLDNNADLDRPQWPVPDLLDIPMRYPDNVRRPTPLKDTKWVVPANEHPVYRIEHSDIHQEMKDIEKEEKNA